MTTTPDPSPLPPDPIGLSEAAHLLGLAPCTLWRMVRDGRLRGWRVGRRNWKVSKSEVLALVTPSTPRPEVQRAADRAAELAEVDVILRREGIRR